MIFSVSQSQEIKIVPRKYAKIYKKKHFYSNMPKNIFIPRKYAKTFLHILVEQF